MTVELDPKEKEQELDPTNPTIPTDEDPKNPTDGDPVNPPSGKTFTQEELETILKKRLEQEKRVREAALEKEREEADRKRLEEQEQYKELYEKLQADLEAQRATALQAKKESLLVKAGYSDEQATTLSKLLEGEDDDALTASLESVKTLFPPKKDKEYGDPNPGNGGRQTPKKTDLEQKGKSAFQRLKASGKIR